MTHAALPSSISFLHHPPGVTHNQNNRNARRVTDPTAALVHLCDLGIYSYPVFHLSDLSRSLGATRQSQSRKHVVARRCCDTAEDRSRYCGEEGGAHRRTRCCCGRQRKAQDSDCAHSIIQVSSIVAVECLPQMPSNDLTPRLLRNRLLAFGQCNMRRGRRSCAPPKDGWCASRERRATAQRPRGAT